MIDRVGGRPIDCIETGSAEKNARRRDWAAQLPSEAGIDRPRRGLLGARARVMLSLKRPIPMEGRIVWKSAYGDGAASGAQRTVKPSQSTPNVLASRRLVKAPEHVSCSISTVRMPTRRRVRSPPHRRALLDPFSLPGDHRRGERPNSALPPVSASAPEHNPVVLGKVIATLDFLTGGRALLGVGIGWLAEESAALGIPLSGARIARANISPRCANCGARIPALIATCLFLQRAIPAKPIEVGSSRSSLAARADRRAPRCRTR